MVEDPGALPWYKRFPREWRGYPALRRCSLGARGLACEMMDLMHEGEPYGHLAFRGLPLTTADLAQQLGVSEVDVIDAMAELDANQVFGKTFEGLYFCRHLIAVREASLNASRRGRLGGNPKLKRRPPASDATPSKLRLRTIA